MSLKGESNGREKYASGFQTPGMLKIIADVHQQVDEHRVRNGKHKWNWNIRARLQVFIPGWIAKFSVSNANQSRKSKSKENTTP